MAILIEDEKEFAELIVNYNDALDYIEYLESLLDAAVYQERSFNRKFVKKIEERNYGEASVEAE